MSNAIITKQRKSSCSIIRKIVMCKNGVQPRLVAYKKALGKVQGLLNFV